MTTEAPAAEAEKTILIFHTGKGNGPMSTSSGPLLPGQSLEVPESLAAKLTAAYKHIKYAKDIIPGGGQDPRIARENAMLKKEIERLGKELGDINEQGPKAIEAAKAEGAAEGAKALEEANAKIADLQARLKDFLEAKDKKGLEALQEKHAEAVAA